MSRRRRHGITARGQRGNLDPDQQTLGYYERGSRRVCDVAECAVLVPPLQKTLEDVRSNQFQNTPADFKHLDVVYGDGGVSLAPSFDRFQTTELSLKVDDETYSYNAEAFFQVNQGLLTGLDSVCFNKRDGRGCIGSLLRRRVVYAAFGAPFQESCRC